MGWNLLLECLFVVHLCSSIATPSVSHVEWIGMNEFILWLDDACWPLLFLLCFFLFQLVIKCLLSFLEPLLVLLFLLFFCHLIQLGLVNLLLELRLGLGD